MCSWQIMYVWLVRSLLLAVQMMFCSVVVWVWQKMLLEHRQPFRAFSGASLVTRWGYHRRNERPSYPRPPSPWPCVPAQLWEPLLLTSITQYCTFRGTCCNCFQFLTMASTSLMAGRCTGLGVSICLMRSLSLSLYRYLEFVGILNNPRDIASLLDSINGCTK